MAKNLMITGSFTPDICGVGDYTCMFMRVADESWKLFYHKDWHLKSIWTIFKDIHTSGCDNIFLQYPTQGYGWSLLPQLLCIYFSLFTRKRFLSVIHEFSQRSFKAKLATALLLFSNKLIFTNEFEKKYAVDKFHVREKKCSVVRILSNIEKPDHLLSWGERHYDICYFGHLRPNKGLEDFFNTVRSVNRNNKYRVLIIGQQLPVFKEYFEDLKKKIQ